VFWTWFPFGRAGIRTGLLFICAFSIFVLRVAQLHAGARTSHSEFQAFKDYALRYQTLQTAGWYLFSAWLFCEVFIFTAPSDANIKWFTDAEINGRPRLNERPIYLTTFFLILALVQTGFHIAYDYDRIELPLIKTSAGNSADGGKRLPAIITPSASLRRALPAIAQHSVQRALIMMCATPVIYSLFIRKSAWGYTLKFAKVFWKLPRSSALPLVKPFHLGLLARTFWGGFLLTMLWEVGNKAFSIYVSQEPLKNDRPITYESRDPNGSLLTGLKGKKLQTQVCLLTKYLQIYMLIILGFRILGTCPNIRTI
jgi:nucleoporin NDC1